MLELSRSFPLFVLLAVLTACSGQAIGAVSDDTSQTLTIYSGRSESLVGPVIEQFEEASGIDVEVRYGATSEMAATLLEEGNNSPADVFFAQDPGGLGAVTDLLAPLPEDILHQVDGRFRDPKPSNPRICPRTCGASPTLNGSAVSVGPLPTAPSRRW
jgi:ABC-type thiamine transport system substrate-binding protein